MNQQEFIRVVMNPVRQRIIQYLILHEEGTAASFKEELNDIPTASLYRHIKVLYEAGCIEVIRECRKRGTVEKTYALVKQPLGEGECGRADSIRPVFPDGFFYRLFR